MKISLVQRHDYPAVISQFADQIKSALSRGQGDSMTFDEVVESINTGKAAIWAAHEGDQIRGIAVISTPAYTTGKKVFVELLGGGKLDSWAKDMEAALVTFRRELGAMCVEASCRPGLARFLKRRGWRQKAVIMEAPA